MFRSASFEVTRGSKTTNLASVPPISRPSAAPASAASPECVRVRRIFDGCGDGWRSSMCIPAAAPAAAAPAAAADTEISLRRLRAPATKGSFAFSLTGSCCRSSTRTSSIVIQLTQAIQSSLAVNPTFFDAGNQFADVVTGTHLPTP
jgi:hypothetical protein